MKPNELYACDPKEERTGDLYWPLFSYGNDLIPEFVGHEDIPEEVWEAQTRVTVRLYEDHDVDQRRCWTLGAVYFDGDPVMVIRIAGREGRDHRSRFVTDWDRYVAMFHFLNSLLDPEPDDSEFSDVVDPDKDIPDLTEFYGMRWTPDGE